MKLGEYGVVFQFNASFNMNLWTTLTLTFSKPGGTKLIKTNPDVTLGGVDITTPLGVFKAYEYVSYTFVDGDIDQDGVWSVFLTYDSTIETKHLESDPFLFTVTDPACPSSPNPIC